MRQGQVLKAAAAPDMEKINRYTRRAYRPEEVYAFSLVLCDNEVDRDYERFSREALRGLAELFPGKTLLFDHQRRAAGQTARIYDTGLEEDPGRLTQAGEPYARLTARAYLPRTPGNREVIELIESGILKEVSVGNPQGGERGVLHEALGVLPVRQGAVLPRKGAGLWGAGLPPGAGGPGGRLRVLLCGGARPAGRRGGKTV